MSHKFSTIFLCWRCNLCSKPFRHSFNHHNIIATSTTHTAKKISQHRSCTAHLKKKLLPLSKADYNADFEESWFLVKFLFLRSRNCVVIESFVCVGYNSWLLLVVLGQGGTVSYYWLWPNTLHCGYGKWRYLCIQVRMYSSLLNNSLPKSFGISRCVVTNMKIAVYKQ